jgi:gamma-glutamyltranspeptidase / glutathione hydrolase
LICGLPDHNLAKLVGSAETPNRGQRGLFHSLPTAAQRIKIPVSMKTTLVLDLCVSAFCLAGIWQSADLALAGDSTKAVVRSNSPTGNGGMVSSGHELATLAGVEVLENGGNAFDAAVAVASTLTVVEPMMSNLFGGYGTLIIYDAKSGELRYLDNNGRFPKATNADVFRKAKDPSEMLRTAAAVSTPGNLHGFEALWKQYGMQPWGDLLRRATRLAAEGVTVSEPLARSLRDVWSHLSAYTKAFYGKDGAPLEAGDLLVQKDLAESLRITAKQGAAALYGGVLGQKLDAEMKRRGGFLSIEDLLEHKAEWFKPISIDYKGYRVVTAGPPSNSFAALVTAGIMSRYDNAALGCNSTAYLHRFAEATKHAFWARLKYAGGPEQNPPPLNMLLSEAYWQQQAQALTPDRATKFEPPSPMPKEGEDTTHFVVADRWGNVVSATVTLGHGFGSTVMVEGTGIWLNNSMAYCTFVPAGNPMDALPGNRKHSSKSPTIILKDGRPWVAIGTPGGHTIPQSIAQMVINLIDFKMDLQEAIDTPRIAFAEPDALLVDGRISAEIQHELEALGHNVRRTSGIGLPHALRIEYDHDGHPSHFVGAADSRGIGKAVGLNVIR